MNNNNRTLKGNHNNMQTKDWAKLQENIFTTKNNIQLFSELSTSGGENNQCLLANVVDECDNDDDGDEIEDIKLRHLIDSCLDHCDPNYQTTITKSVDDFLQEIDEIMLMTADGANSEMNNLENSKQPGLLYCLTNNDPMRMMNVPLVKRLSFYNFPLEKLKSLTVDQLQDLNEDLEYKVQRHSEVLISELARRDELEFEKEIKNRFISLMLQIQNRRKEYFHMQQRSRCNNGLSTEKIHENFYNNKNNKRNNNFRRYCYLTTIIPYNCNETVHNIAMLQVVIKSKF